MTCLPRRGGSVSLPAWLLDLGFGTLRCLPPSFHTSLSAIAQLCSLMKMFLNCSRLGGLVHFPPFMDP